MLVFFTNLSLTEFQVRYLALFLLFLVIDGFGQFWMESLYKNIQLVLEFLKAPFLVLHFSYLTLTGPNLDLLCVWQSNPTHFCEIYANLYFDAKHLENWLNSWWWNFWWPFFFFSKKVPFWPILDAALIFWFRPWLMTFLMMMMLISNLSVIRHLIGATARIGFWTWIWSKWMGLRPWQINFSAVKVAKFLKILGVRFHWV